MLGAISDWLRHLARRRRWAPNLASGRRGEDLAHRFLRRSGYIIVARNYRLPTADGEADLIAWEGDTLVIVEVKARQNDEFGPPERAIGDDKRAHLRRVARAYARKTDTPWERVRCDVVTVIFSSRPQLHLVRGAFRI
jgi:putative endonuclease